MFDYPFIEVLLSCDWVWLIVWLVLEVDWLKLDELFAFGVYGLLLEAAEELELEFIGLFTFPLPVGGVDTVVGLGVATGIAL